MVKHPRFYLFDTGLTNALTHQLAASSDSFTRGRQFGQWVILETVRLVDYLGLEARCFC